MSSTIATLIELLRTRAQIQPEKRAFTFLVDGEEEEAHLTYGELDQRARAIGSMLQSMGAEGERVLLLYPPGLEYICGFWGCIYAGMVAVPSYPPRLNRPDPRLQTIARDSQARIALTTPEIVASIQQRLANTPDLASITWLTTSSLDPSVAEQWRETQGTSGTLAFLQYTSGSTSQPKGVMVSHGNLIHNLEQIQDFFGLDSQSRGVYWLPPFHDMGLIGGLLETLYAGYSAVLMPPAAFIQKPIRWLQAISRYRGTACGGPNFAYDFCVERITEEQKKGLDLSSWESAFNGSEPVRRETLERFAATFESCGFRREAFYPCYGLAEGTLIATGGAKGTWPSIRTFAGDELAQGRVALAGPEDRNPRELVSCGTPSPDQQLLIVDPQTLQRCPSGRVGEIWLAGPSVAQGYWNRAEESRQTFQAVLSESGEGPFLRTGDLGFLQDGELFIAGRIKDLIIIRGWNHYPQDIELSVEQSHPALAPSCGAAFSIEKDGEEQLVVVQEVERHARQDDKDVIFGAIRKAIAEQHEVQPYAIVLIKPGSIPKTSSGKIQRHACRARYLEGSLKVISEWTRDRENNPAVRIPRPKLTTAYVPPRNELEQKLAAIWQNVLGIAQVGTEDSFLELGGDSLLMARVSGRLREQLQRDLTIIELFEFPTISALAKYISLSEHKPLDQSRVPLPSNVPISKENEEEIRL